MGNMASFGRWKLLKTRSGRRPISVDKLLKREAEGKVFHKHGADQISGGLADNKKPSDFSGAVLAKGIKVEREHTSSNSIAREIAMDHLTEDGDYYEKLDKLEKHSSITTDNIGDVVKGLGLHERHATNLPLVRSIARTPDLVETPFPARLASYKHWLETGRVKPMFISKKGIKFPGFGEELSYVQSNEPITLYSGGQLGSLRAALKNPQTQIDHPYVIPGQTQAMRKGLYLGGTDESSRYVGRGREGYGSKEPAVAKVVVPRRMLLGDPRFGATSREHLQALLPTGRDYSSMATIEKHAFKLDGGTTFQGLDIAIENDVGSIRNPKYVGSVSPVPMERLHALIESGKKLTKISAVSRPTHDLDFVNNDFGETGIPAKLPRRRLELPSRDDVENSPRSTVEQRHDSRGTIVVGELGTPGAFNDVGKSAAVNKISKAMETLGQLSRSWEVPTDSAPASSADNSAESVDHHGPFGVTLSDIGPQAGDEWEGTGQASEMATRITKNASAFYGGLVEELGRLNAVTQGQLAKVAEVTREQAQVALEKLDELEHQKPTLGQLSRGAAVGSVVGPVASNVNKLIAHGELHSPREMLGQIAGGAIFGIATPMLKHKVETGTERKVLKDYVGSGHGGRLATKIEDKLGTP